MNSAPLAVPFSWRPFAWWIVGFALLGAPLVFCPHASNLSNDESEYYLPSIAQIRSHWPRIDLVGDSLSATGPGYAFLLATVSFVVGTSTPALRAVNWLVSLGVLATLWSLLQRRGGMTLTLGLAPLALSNFFVKSSGWVVTDNAALLLITIALVALFTSAPKNALRTGTLAAVGAVAVRQVNAWSVVPLAWRAWTDFPSRRRVALLVVLLPLIPLVCYLIAWRGLVPPAWQPAQFAEGGVSAASLIYLLTVVASLGLPFYFAVATIADCRDALRQPWLWVLAGLAVALVCSTSTVRDHAAGRWGGYWWSLAAHLPYVGRVSSLFFILTPLGAVVLGALIRKLWRNAGAKVASLWTASLGAWAASTLVNHFVFHRYFEPPLLVFLACWLGLLAGAPGFRLARSWPLGGLAAAQLALTLVTVHAQAYGLVKFE